MECLKKEGERGSEIEGEREKEQHSYTGPSVCRKGRAVKQGNKEQPGWHDVCA